MPPRALMTRAGAPRRSAAAATPPRKTRRKPQPSTPPAPTRPERATQRERPAATMAAPPPARKPRTRDRSGRRTAAPPAENRPNPTKPRRTRRPAPPCARPARGHITAAVRASGVRSISRTAGNGNERWCWSVFSSANGGLRSSREVRRAMRLGSGSALFGAILQ